MMEKDSLSASRLSTFTPSGSASSSNITLCGKPLLFTSDWLARGHSEGGWVEPQGTVVAAHLHGCGVGGRHQQHRPGASLDGLPDVCMASLLADAAFTLEKVGTHTAGGYSTDAIADRGACIRYTTLARQLDEESAAELLLQPGAGGGGLYDSGGNGDADGSLATT